MAPKRTAMTSSTLKIFKEVSKICVKFKAKQSTRKKKILYLNKKI